MSKFLHGIMAVLMSVMTSAAFAQQVSNANFEDWSGSFDGQPQPAGWNASNVEQVGMKFNFAHKESGHSGYAMMVQDQSVGAMGITETSPGYFSLGVPWAYLPSITAINQATAGTEGGVSWKYRPDSMSVWIKRTGDNWDKEDFYLLYYAWSGTAKGNKYKGKNGDCTSTERTNEESDVRRALNGNECGTTQTVTQVAEGMWRERKQYGQWTNIRVPIYYMNNTVPTMMNIIFSASNYPNFRANSGLYEGNSLYVDDVEMIYATTIQKLFVNGDQWKGFDPNSSDVQYFPLGEDATSIPSIEAIRGAGSITNAKGTTVPFPGRTLSGSEISIVNGDLTSTPTTITVTSDDGKQQRTYKIQFQKAASSNTKLAGISYQFNDKSGKTVTASVADFNPSKKSYNVEIPYGATSAPVLTEELIDKQEEKQKLAITQAGSITGTATIKVTAPNDKTTDTYTLKFSEAKLADNTLAGITVNGKEIPGFAPNQTVYKVSLPVGTSVVPEIKGISEYPAGAQTMEYVLPSADKLDGGQAQIKVTTPGNPTPKIYKLNFKLEASSYSYLKSLTISGDQIYKVNPAKEDDPLQLAFAPDNLTYYVTLQMGATTLPQIKAEKGDEYQAEPVIDTSAGVDGTTRITATAANGDQTTYKIVFSTMKSEISTLSDLKINGVTIEDFAEDKTVYDYALKIGTTELPTIEPVADKYATVVIKTGGVNGTTRITVTAGNGNTTVYLINFSVAAYTDNTLKSLSVEGYSLLDKDGAETSYNADVTEYWVKLAKGVETLPNVNFVKQDEKLQTVNTRDGGVNGDYRITVRPQGGASQTYIIHFSVEKSENCDLAALYIDGVSLDFNLFVLKPGTPLDTLEYIDSLPKGVSAVPTVTFKKGEDKQKVLSVLEKKTQIITVTAESGAQKLYAIRFIPRMSSNAYLLGIYFNNDTTKLAPLTPAFESKKTEYEFQLVTDTIPTITVKKDLGQQVTIVKPVGVGTAKIMVAPEAGGSNIYTITFLPKVNEAVTLKNIFIDGVALAGFEPSTTAYNNLHYSNTLPTVTCEKHDEEQKVDIISNEDTVWLHVEDAQGSKVVYRLDFTRDYNTSVELAAIRANGALLPAWAPAKHTYDSVLPAGQTYPELTYEKNNDAQRVTFGQTGEGKYEFIVVSEDGKTGKYNVNYTVQAYTDVKLADIELEGGALVFDEENNEYGPYTVDEGKSLPDMTITRKAGQTVLLANVDDTTQTILVTAENGATGNYIIKYARKKSDNAVLAGILLDGAPIDTFRAEVLNYVDTLKFRTNAIPTIFPLRGNDNQTIETEYCYPNGTATIKVTSQDGSKQTTYTIAFPVRKSNNTELEDVMLYDESDDQIDFGFKSDKTDYEVAAEYQATKAPRIVWTKAEPEQRVDFVSRPLGQTSELKVTAQNGDTKTYTFKFTETLAKEANRLSALSVIIDDDEDGETELSLKDKTKRDFDLTLPYNARKLTVKYSKMFPEQTVFIQPGGVNYPTKLTVKSNRPDEADEIYTINPVKTTQNPAVLDSIKVDGVKVPNFDPNRFTYIVNRSTKSYPKVQAFKKSGVETEPESSMYKWQCTVSKDGVSNTYILFFHYTNEVIPNADFKLWTGKAQYNDGDKPDGWQVPADFFDNVEVMWVKAKTGAEVVKKGTMDGHDGVVGLETTYWSTAGGALPAIITLGKLSGSLTVANKTHYDFYDYIDFHNTPDAISVTYKHETQKDNGAYFAIRFKDAENTEHPFDFTDKTTGAFKTETKPLTLDGKTIVGMNIAVDATNKELGASSGAKLYIDKFELSYNSTPKTAKVNGINAPLSGKVFTATIEDPEDVNIRSYEFNGEVSDQAQVLNGWSDTTHVGNYAVRSTNFTNYAEDGTSTTGYSLTVKRKLSTDNTLKELYVGGKTVDISSGTYEHHLKSTEKILPDVYPIPNSLHQQITCAYADSTLTITVKPEKGDDKVYKVRFITDLSDDTELASLKVGDHTLDATEMSERKATITAGFMPNITFEKKSDLQIVEVDGGTITVTAENGIAKGTYTITRNDTVPTKGNGQLKDFVIDGTDISSDEFGLTKTAITLARPDSVRFTYNAGDLISFTQNAEKLEWKVTGNSIVTYTLTYPDSKTNVAQLKELLINGQPWSDFVATQTTVQKIYADSAIVIEVIPDNDYQTLTIAQNPAAAPAPARNGKHSAPSINSAEVEYSVKVTSADESKTMNYTIQVVRPKSTNDSLAAILIDGVALTAVIEDSVNNVITLPSPTIKSQQPDMPSITYIAGHHGQQIEVQNGTFGVPTQITVTAEDGLAKRDYYVTINAEPSHYSSLSGIMVNGAAVDDFEPGRHNYSVQVPNDQPEIIWTSLDRFQNVSIIKNKNQYTLRVTAEDGVTKEEYYVDVYVKELSDNTQLSNILIERADSLVSFADFDRTLNPDLAFRPLKFDYVINLPSGTTLAPSVSAVLSEDGQSIDVVRDDENPLKTSIIVTAPNGTSKNTYELNFTTPPSKNANLNMIFLDGDSITTQSNKKFIGMAFDPENYVYQVKLREGIHKDELPEINVQKADANQSIGTYEVDTETNRYSIPVTAEDPSYTRKYMVIFELTPSAADTLNMIYADDDTIRVFTPSVFFYNDTLPVGSAYPDLSWDKADPWQTVKMDTVQNTPQTMTRRINVTAENGQKNVYIFTYNIRPSDIDTLQSIYLDKRELTPFYGTTNEYFYTLSAAAAAELGGRLPEIEFIKGDTAQNVSIVQTPDSLDSKSLGYKSLITVTAASGKTRTYIIHYPVEKSSDATLNMIMLSGKPIANFDSERQVYRLSVDEGADLPLVSVVKKEDAQTYDIRFSGDSIYVDVLAENGAQMTYSLFFERRLSSNALLKDLIVAGHEEMRFRSDEYDYQFRLPYGTDTIPTITWVLQDSLQTVPDSLQLDTLETGAILATITVVAPNKEDEATYSVTFIFEKNSDNTLLAIILGTDTLQGFDPRLTEYTYNHPFGKDSTAFYGLDKVSYVLSDPLATDTMYMDEQGVIYILVTAQNGKENVYTLSQSILLDSDNALSAILLDGDTIRGFDPDVLSYTYFVADGSVPPMLEAFARSANAEEPTWREVSAGDTCVITVRAQDKSERVYKVHFAISTLNEAIDATAEDVLIKRIPGTCQIFIGTLRAGVTFGLYDQYGHPFFVEPLKVTPANVNDADIIINADQREQLNDIYNERSGIVIDLEPGQVYLYGFYLNGGKKNIKSGKMMIKP